MAIMEPAMMGNDEEAKVRQTGIRMAKDPRASQRFAIDVEEVGSSELVSEGALLARLAPPCDDETEGMATKISNRHLLGHACHS